MRSAVYWFVFGVYMVVGVVMLFLGALFLRHVYVSLWMSDDRIAFSSLFLGVILFLVGGRILFSALASSIKRAVTRKYGW